ncbi:HAD-IIIA family hydrolase [Paenibacillus sp. OV219]|uniref:HAD-IIIA family hydrolase n=1 Tax=Paenibacillus sp. OV219 TaxID=1884377 RepID=UPI0008B3DC22|nr:HAD-IIIA family hydrolase [Paenibacillus sp. OV219]SEO06432.1 histidinol-phosphate phosphatase family domain-containing protein/HAD-superfamily hydrolase, subfamily IIIA [Paenibacillus sp. OV219]
MSSLQAVFIDRDGTIGGTGHFIHPRQFELFPGVQEALLLLKKHRIKVIAFTNQHNIAKGLATEQEFMEQFESYGFDASYICPHEPEEGCGCHKPRPGMLHLAAEEHQLDLTNCAVIGDVGSTDMLAAAAVGARKVLVKTGWGQKSLDTYRHKWYDQASPDYIADDLMDGARWLIKDLL